MIFSRERLSVVDGDIQCDEHNDPYIVHSGSSDLKWRLERLLLLVASIIGVGRSNKPKVVTFYSIPTQLVP